jgi:NDP-sugar pyrophosphorylase family protein
LPEAKSEPRTAVVLSGGAGIRLRPITNDLPKGLVSVGGKPLLQWVVEWLAASGVKNIVMGVAFLKEKIMDFFGDGARFGVQVKYSVHSVEGGTGEGFRLAISRYVEDPTFYALNGDQITDVKLKPFLTKHVEKNAIATIAVVHPKLPFGLVKVDKNDNCIGFSEKPVLSDRFISTGIYLFQRNIIEYIPTIGDVEKTTFPQLVRMNKLAAYRHPGSFITVNSLRELEEAEAQLKELKQN